MLEKEQKARCVVAINKGDDRLTSKKGEQGGELGEYCEKESVPCL